MQKCTTGEGNLTGTKNFSSILFQDEREVFLYVETKGFEKTPINWFLRTRAVSGPDRTVLTLSLEDQPKVPKDQSDTLGDTLADRIIVLIRDNPQITQGELAEATKVSVPSIKRAIKILSG